MSSGNNNNATATGVKMRQYAASGSVRDFVTDSPDGKTCARMVMLLAAGSFTGAKDASNTLIPAATPGTLGPFGSGAQLPGQFSELISASADILVFW